jgi:hypothetical protein
MAQITYDDKQDNRQLTTIPDNQKVVAADMNEIKYSVNALYDLIAGMRVPTWIAVASGDFAGNNYTNSALALLTAGIDFNVFTNGGSGTLLRPASDYTFNSATGVITTTPDNYQILLFAKTSS